MSNATIMSSILFIDLSRAGAQADPTAPPVPQTTNRSPVTPRRNRPPGSANRTHAPAPPPPPQSQPQPQVQPHQAHQPHQPHPAQASLPSFTHPQSLQAPQAQAPPSVMHPGPSLPPTNFQFPVYPGQNQHPAGRPTLQPPTSGPPQTWQTTGLTAHVPHPQLIAPRHQNPYGRDDQWNEQSFAHLDPTDASNTLPAINGGSADGYYDQRYRDQNGWPESTQNYYEQPVSSDRNSKLSQLTSLLKSLMYLRISRSSRTNSNNHQRHSCPRFLDLLRSHRSLQCLRILVLNGNREEERGQEHK